MTPYTAKVKCKHFLSTLLRLVREQQPVSVATNVQMFIQMLVDAKIEPEEFTTKLQRELNSSPQPCLIPFLKVNTFGFLSKNKNRIKSGFCHSFFAEKFALLEALTGH